MRLYPRWHPRDRLVRHPAEEAQKSSLARRVAATSAVGAVDLPHRPLDQPIGHVEEGLEGRLGEIRRGIASGDREALLKVMTESQAKSVGEGIADILNTLGKTHPLEPQ